MERSGWFLPNQISDLLNFFKVKTVDDLLKTGKLAIDWWSDDDKDEVHVLVPNLKGNDDHFIPFNPSGKCIFFIDGKCEIEQCKPYECREYMCTDAKKKVLKRHQEIARQWKNITILDKYEYPLEKKFDN